MTLIEIMVVVAIIGLVMGAVSFRLYNKFIESQINISEQAVVQAKSFFTSYQLTHRECPESLQDLVDDICSWKVKRKRRRKLSKAASE